MPADEENNQSANMNLTLHAELLKMCDAFSLNFTPGKVDCTPRCKAIKRTTRKLSDESLRMTAEKEASSRADKTLVMAAIYRATLQLGENNAAVTKIKESLDSSGGKKWLYSNEEMRKVISRDEKPHNENKKS